MDHKDILQLLKENGIEGAIRRARPPGSHTPAVAAENSARLAKAPEYLLDWVRVEHPDIRGTVRMRREEALQLIAEGIRDEAGLIPTA